MSAMDMRGRFGEGIVIVQGDGGGLEAMRWTSYVTHDLSVAQGERCTTIDNAPWGGAGAGVAPLGEFLPIHGLNRFPFRACSGQGPEQGEWAWGGVGGVKENTPLSTPRTG